MQLFHFFGYKFKTFGVLRGQRVQVNHFSDNSESGFAADFFIKT